MKPNNIITLTAFLTALTKLEEPALPEVIQVQLNEIGENLKNDPNDIGNLNLIARSYIPLYKIYQQELANLDDVNVRTKGLEPEPLPTKPTSELTNAAINAFNDSNSITVARNIVTPTFLEKIRKFITGK